MIVGLPAVVASTPLSTGYQRSMTTILLTAIKTVQVTENYQPNRKPAVMEGGQRNHN